MRIIEVLRGSICTNHRGKVNTIILTQEHTEPEGDKYYNVPMFIARIQETSSFIKLRELKEDFPEQESTCVLDILDNICMLSKDFTKIVM